MERRTKKQRNECVDSILAALCVCLFLTQMTRTPILGC